MADLEYLSLNKTMRYAYRFKHGFINAGHSISNFFKSLPYKFKNTFIKIGNNISEIKDAFVYGDIKTKLSFFIFGFGNLANGQIVRGLLYFIFEVAFILYMVFFGGQYLAKFASLGTIEYDSANRNQPYDISFYILLYSILSILLICCFVATWYMNVKQAYATQKFVEINKKLAKSADDFKALGSSKYHITLLSFPMAGLIFFTVLPLIFTIFVAFTNFNNDHMFPIHLFTWVGFDNFETVFNGKGMGIDASKFARTFWALLLWTLVWAFLATFTNFYLGMIVALIINKKGIKLKKFWRTMLVTTIAVPQFVSLMLMSKMLSPYGVINSLLQVVGWQDASNPTQWLNSPWLARMSVILVNLWVGIPYTVISCTGILMNVSDDLYEAAKIDGANPYKMFINITLPYMMFVMTPALISSFVGNINNFNVIFLLTGGNPADINLASTAGDTDLLITWLYKLTVNNQQYNIASVIGILVFVVVAFFSLVFYSRSNSLKNEEEFQ